MINFRIGDTLPPAQVRGIVSGPDTPPVWHVLIVPAQRERAVREYLRARDIFAFFPSEKHIRHHRGRKIETERPVVTQHVYAQFRQQPQWDVMKRVHRLITGVMCRDGIPVEVKPDIIRHLQGLTVEAERLKQARAEMLRVRPGDKARIIAGPLEGFMVEVQDVRNGEAIINLMMGGRTKASVSSLERDMPLDNSPTLP
jgi:transcription antitermination factor NusG